MSTTLLAASGMVLAAVLAAAMPAAAVTPTPFNTNLARNGGAENGVTGWDVFPTGKVVARSYGPAGFGYPPKSEGKRIGGGAHFFTSKFDGVFNECGYAKQDINLKGIGGAIDNGHVKVVLKGYAATNGAAEMRAHIDLQFFNSEHHTDNISQWGIQKQALSTNETYKTLQAGKVLPAHTRIVQLQLYQTPGDGSVGCQASWDKISVVLVHV